MFQDSVRRIAELRFGHPYAVVAVAAQPDGAVGRGPGLSAWVGEPEDATD